MELQDHQTHLKNLVSQANTLSSEIETKKKSTFESTRCN